MAGLRCWGVDDVYNTIYYDTNYIFSLFLLFTDMSRLLLEESVFVSSDQYTRIPMDMRNNESEENLIYQKTLM